jgi:hypothetical protein
VANQRRRKNRIVVLEGPLGDEVMETQDMLPIFVNYYKNLFKKEERTYISLDNSFWVQKIGFLVRTMTCWMLHSRKKR